MSTKPAWIDSVDGSEHNLSPEALARIACIVNEGLGTDVAFLLEIIDDRVATNADRQVLGWPAR